MIAPAIYLLKVTLISGILFGYYALALRNERFHEWNRYYLLSSALISLLLPFARWPALFSGYGGAEPVYVARLQAFTFSVHSSGTVHLAGIPHWIQWAGIIYALVALSLIIGIGSGLLKIYHRIRQGEKQHFTFFTLVQNRLDESPFSFFHFIFWNRRIALESEEGNHMLRHEIVHVQEKHSWDKLLMELILALFWINPFFYLIRRELHVIHEFIADRQACRAEETQHYATLLVKQALRTNHIMFASHFFQRQLRRRVHMLIRENKARFTWLKRVMAVPPAVCVMLFFLFLQSEAKDKNRSLAGHVHEAIEKTVSFTDMPTAKDNKAKQNGRKIAGQYALPIRFTLDDQNTGQRQPPPPPPPSPGPAVQKNSPDGVFSFVEQMPSFPGGETAMRNYLHGHVRYPFAARNEGIQGTVVVQFVVNTDGSLSDIHTAGRRKGGGLEEEAIRLVKGMPAWAPGIQSSQKVAVQYSLPIRFVLQ